MCGRMAARPQRRSDGIRMNRIMVERALTRRTSATNARLQLRWLIKPVIQALDRLLRRYYGVHEYTDDPGCIFRIALGTAGTDLTLQPGMLVRSRDTVAELHLWNEHLPLVSPDGPNMAWGALVDRRIRHSLTLLADHLAAYPHVVAVHGETAFGCQMGPRQMRQFARRYGFEIIGGSPTLRSRVRHFCDDFLFWGLTQAFNPYGLKGKPIHRPRFNIWISRTELQQRWSAAAPEGRATAAEAGAMDRAQPSGGQVSPA